MTFVPDFKKPPREKRPRKPLNRWRPSTGEFKIFTEIYAERERYCFVCGKPIKHFDIKNFSHVLPKSHYSKYRLNKENILLKCTDCHFAWHNAHENLREKPEWKPVYELYETLKEKYNKEKK